MKASIFAGLVIGASASILSRQVVNPTEGFLLINGTLTTVIGLVQNLDAAVVAYQSGADITPVTDAANSIVSTAEGAVPSVVATNNVTSDDEVLALANIVGDPLEPAAKSVVKNLEAKKDAIQANNLCETAFTTANNIYNATADLGFTIAGKIDNANYGFLAVPLINELLAIIAEAQLAFQPSNCTDSGPIITTTTTTTTSTSTDTSTGTSTDTTTTTTTTGTTTSTGTVTYGPGYGSAPYTKNPYGNSTAYYGGSSTTYGYGASQPAHPTNGGSGYSTYVKPSPSYPANNGGSGSGGYPNGGGNGGGNGGNGGSYPAQGPTSTGSHGAYPTGSVPYTGGANAVAPAGALVLAVAALLM